MYLMAEIKFWMNAFVSPVSLILNILLFYLIRNHTSKNLNNYKKVLYLGFTEDFVFAFWNMLFHADTGISGTVYFMVTRGFLGYLPGAWAASVFLVSAFLIYFSVVNVAIQFIYRYLLLCWKITLNLASFLALVGIGVSVIMVYLHFFIYNLFTRTVFDEEYAYLLNESVWTVDGKPPPFGAFNLEEFGNIFFITYGMVVVSYTIVGFCGIGIFRNISKNSENLNKEASQYQRQISIVMTIEAIIPLLTVAIPILVELNAILLRISAPWLGKVVFLIGGLSTLINPLVKLTIISCYRRRLVKQFKWKKPLTSKNTVFTVSINSTVSHK